MNDDTTPGRSAGQAPPLVYHPPAVTYLGDLADLTRQVGKAVGGADGTTFLGLDIGS